MGKNISGYKLYMFEEQEVLIGNFFSSCAVFPVQEVWLLKPSRSSAQSIAKHQQRTRKVPRLSTRTPAGVSALKEDP